MFHRVTNRVLAYRQPWTIVESRARLIRVPVQPPRGDAIQKFSALELVLVRITDAAGNSGVGFGYTIGQGGSTITELLRRELLKSQVRDAAEDRVTADSITILPSAPIKLGDMHDEA